MHDSVMKFLEYTLLRDYFVGMSVLEVGSRNVNGSARDVVSKLNPSKYIGVDAEPGPGVDVVLRAEELGSLKAIALEPRLIMTFDLVISTEMLEHCEDWRGAVSAMKRLTGVCPGILVVTTRSPGFPRHEHPGDYWRFTKDDFKKIFADMDIALLQDDPQPMHPGVFIVAHKRAGYSDAVDLSKIDVMRAPQA